MSLAYVRNVASAAFRQGRRPTRSGIEDNPTYICCQAHLDRSRLSGPSAEPNEGSTLSDNAAEAGVSSSASLFPFGRDRFLPRERIKVCCPRWPSADEVARLEVQLIAAASPASITSNRSFKFKSAKWPLVVLQSSFSFDCWLSPKMEDPLDWNREKHDEHCSQA